MGIDLGINPKVTTARKVKNKLSRDASKKANEKKAADREKKLNLISFKAEKIKYDALKKEAIQKVAEGLTNVWKAQVVAKWKLGKKDPALTDEEWKAFDDDVEKQRIEVFELVKMTHNAAMESYVEAYQKFQPGEKYEKTVDQLWDYVRNRGGHESRKQIRKIEKQAKKFISDWNNQFDGQRIIKKQTQKLAEIPYKIEEKLDNFKYEIETYLGRCPDNFVDKYFGKELSFTEVEKRLKIMLDAATTALRPIQSIVQIPIVSDVASLLTKNGGGNDDISEEEMKKILEKFKGRLPPPDTTVLTKIQQVSNDILCMTSSLSMSFIQLLLYLLEKIVQLVDKLLPGSAKQPPLDIIPNAIISIKNMISLMWNLSPMMRDYFEAWFKKEMAKMLQFQLPDMELDPKNEFFMAILETKLDMKQKELDTKQKVTYKSVCKEKYESRLFPLGYPKSLADDILKTYLEVFNSSETTLTQIKDDGEQDLQNGKTGYKDTDKVVRKEPSPEDFAGYFEQVIMSQPDIKNRFVYDKVMTTKDLAGEYYEPLKNELKKYGEKVTVSVSIKPSAMLKSIYESDQKRE